jgi:biopolymer transport protein ExbD
MKFPRSTRLFRGQLDLAPFLCVVFPLALVALFHDFLVLPRGARLSLPAVDAPIGVGAGEPILVVAVDSARRLYFENQIIAPDALATALRRRAAEPAAPRTLLVQADVAVPYGQLADLAALARRAGLSHIVFGSVPARKP